jgi:fluoroacetyl-CoA thioesterase
MDARDVIKIGMSAERTLVVPPERTVGHLLPGMPMVYATPMMILEMEMTSGDAINRYLEPGWVTVGTEVDIRHLAASPVGAKVRTTARVIAVERRVIRFEVEAFDDKRRIGEGRHARGLVNVEAFNKRLAVYTALILRSGRLAASRRMDHGAYSSFETPRKGAAPQDEVWRKITSPIASIAWSPPRLHGSRATAGRRVPSALPAPRRWCRRAR